MCVRICIRTVEPRKMRVQMEIVVLNFKFHFQCRHEFRMNRNADPIISPDPENKSPDTTTNQVLRLFVYILLQLFSIRIYLRNLFNPKTACTRCPSSIVPQTRIVTGQLSRHHKHSLFLRIKFY